MIFSLLNLRKKTAAAVSGIAIALACLWGLAMWQDISRQEMLEIFGAVLIMLTVIVVCAVLLIATLKLCARILRKLFAREANTESETDRKH